MLIFSFCLIFSTSLKLDETITFSLQFWHGDPIWELLYSLGVPNTLGERAGFDMNAS